MLYSDVWQVLELGRYAKVFIDVRRGGAAFARDPLPHNVLPHETLLP